jgi:hypothetical protein
MTVGQSGTEGSYITTTAYGTGAVPIIKIATDDAYPVISVNGESYLTFNNLHIQHNSGTYIDNALYAGIHLSTDGSNVPHDIIITNCEIDDIPHSCVWGADDSYNITIGDINTTSTATSIAYNNNFHDFGYAGIYLCGRSPSTDRSDWYIYYNYIHDPFTTVLQDCYGIAVGSLSGAPSRGWPRYVNIKYNFVENIKGHEGIDCHGGSYIYIQDNHVKCFGSAGIYVASTDYSATYPNELDNVYIERNIVEQPISGWTTGSEFAFIMQLPASTEATTNLYIRDNIIRYSERPSSNAFAGIRIAHVDGAEISGNKIYNGPTSTGTGLGIILYPDATGHKNVTIKENFIQWNFHSIYMTGSDIIGNITVEDNIIINTNNSVGFVLTDNISATGVLSLYNNTFLTGGRSLDVVGLSAGGIFNIKNNIFAFITSSNVLYFYFDGTNSGTINCDYNLYWNTSSATPFYLGGSRNWAYWTGTFGYDVNSPNVAHGDADLDPLFRNYSGRYNQDHDFDLKATSPAINKGTDVSLTGDYWGFKVLAPPNIGAVEYRKRLWIIE